MLSGASGRQIIAAFEMEIDPLKHYFPLFGSVAYVRMGASLDFLHGSFLWFTASVQQA